METINEESKLKEKDEDAGDRDADIFKNFALEDLSQDETEVEGSDIEIEENQCNEFLDNQDHSSNDYNLGDDECKASSALLSPLRVQNLGSQIIANPPLPDTPPPSNSSPIPGPFSPIEFKENFDNCDVSNPTVCQLMALERATRGKGEIFKNVFSPWK